MCKRGHDLTLPNAYTSDHRCIMCKRIRNKKYSDSPNGRIKNQEWENSPKGRLSRSLSHRKWKENNRASVAYSKYKNQLRNRIERNEWVIKQMEGSLP